jgi:hypothetical protein
VQCDAVDHDFNGGYTTGFTEWKTHVSGIDWEMVTRVTGLTRAQITELAQLLRTSTATVFCWAMGLTQVRSPNELLAARVREKYRSPWAVDPVSLHLPRGRHGQQQVKRFERA